MGRAKRKRDFGHVRTSMDIEGPDQTAHPRSLIRAFTVCSQNHSILESVWIKSNGPDDTLYMYRMT